MASFLQRIAKKMSLFSSDIRHSPRHGNRVVDVKGKGVALTSRPLWRWTRFPVKSLPWARKRRACLAVHRATLSPSRPLREGVISDYEMTERMIKEFIAKVQGIHLFKPNVVICVPSIITEVEERAVIDAGTQAGAKRVFRSRSRSRRPSARASIST